MESKAKLLGHPVHPMLVTFPLALFPVSIIFDALRRGDTAFWLIGFGIIAGLTAAVFGLVDWLAIPRRTRAKRIGVVHGLGNVVVVTLFAISWWLRRDMPATPPSLAIAL